MIVVSGPRMPRPLVNHAPSADRPADGYGCVASGTSTGTFGPYLYAQRGLGRRGLSRRPSLRPPAGSAQSGPHGHGDHNYLGDVAARLQRRVPGQRRAIAVVAATTPWALAKPLERRLPAFPYAFDGE